MTHFVQTQSFSSSDTKGKHRIHAELKRLEQETRYLEVGSYFIFTMFWTFVLSLIFFLFLLFLRRFLLFTFFFLFFHVSIVNWIGKVFNFILKVQCFFQVQFDWFLGVFFWWELDFVLFCRSTCNWGPYISIIRLLHWIVKRVLVFLFNVRSSIDKETYSFLLLLMLQLTLSDPNCRLGENTFNP